MVSKKKRMELEVNYIKNWVKCLKIAFFGYNAFFLLQKKTPEWILEVTKDDRDAQYIPLEFKYIFTISPRSLAPSCIYS